MYVTFIMYINIGGQTPENIENEVNSSSQNCLSSEEVISLDDSDNDNVEFVISSGSDSEWNFDSLSCKTLADGACIGWKRHRTSSDQSFVSSESNVNDPNQMGKTGPLHVVAERKCQFNAGRTRGFDNFNQPPYVSSRWADERDNSRVCSKRFSTPRSSTDFVFEKPSFSKMVYKSKRCCKTRSTKFFILLISYILFMCIGSVCFQHIEKPIQKRHPEEIRKEVISVLEECNCLSGEDQPLFPYGWTHFL